MFCWVFATPVTTKEGGKEMLELYSLSGTPTERHKKVRGAYHPYDPQWEMYGETHRQERMRRSMRYRK